MTPEQSLADRARGIVEATKGPDDLANTSLQMQALQVEALERIGQHLARLLKRAEQGAFEDFIRRPVG